nr:HAMP domain-containing histidine kinase [Lachnospiraceae bacterium]
VNVSIVSFKTTIINTLLVMLYSGVLLVIFYRIEFVHRNGAMLAGAILALIMVASVCIAVETAYVHYTQHTKPLLNLARAAREVSEGNYDTQLPPHRLDGKVDEIDALYQDFNTMVNDLKSTEILQSSFISNISHELKTPIAVISNYSSLLSEEGISEQERKEYAEKIRTTAVDLSTLIANILQITKLDNDQISAKLETFDISEELVQCILGYELILDEKDIDLRLNIPENVNVNSDKGLLKIVFNNIISNALKFTPEKGIIEIDLKQDQEMTIVSFKDNGCGMDDNTVRHIFDKFYQGDTSHATKGNGLGLAMVKQIIALLKGNITVESKPGEGSLFTVFLPKSKDSEI